MTRKQITAAKRNLALGQIHHVHRALCTIMNKTPLTDYEKDAADEALNALDRMTRPKVWRGNTLYFTSQED